MALTNLSQVTSSGIHTLSNYTTHNINSTGIITASSFSGNLSSASGISTFAEIRVTGNLTVEGTTTTLDSNLTEVDRIEVGANTAAVGLALTQSGSGHAATFEGGNFGIGTNNPGATLHVRGSSSPRIENTGTISLIRFQNSSAENVFYGSDADNAVIYTQSTERLRITSGGLVGIGTITPTTALEIRTTTTNAATHYRNNASNGGAYFGVRAADLGAASAGEAYIYSYNSGINLLADGTGYIDFATGGTASKVRITSAGNVGIGSTIPAARLDAYKNFSGAGAGTYAGRVYGLDSGVSETGVRFVTKGTGDLHNASDAYLMHGISNGTTRFVFGANGNVGIGTDNPTVNLEIGTPSDANTFFRMNSSNASFLQLSSTGTKANIIAGRTSGNSDLTFMTSSGGTNYERMRILDDGNIGIGTDDPGTSLLRVQGGTTLLTHASANDATTKAEMISNAALRVRPHTLNSGNLNFAQVNSGASIGLQYTNGPGTADWNIALQPFGGSVGIGTDAAVERLAVVAEEDSSAIDNGLSIYRSVADDKVTINAQGGAAKFIADGGSSYIPVRFFRHDGTNTYETLTISADGNIGVNKTTPKEWYSGYRTIQIYDGGYIAASSDDSFVAIGANNYLDTGGAYDYTNTDYASQLYQVDGQLIFRNAPSGTADTAITWAERLRITSAGKVLINSTDVSNYATMVVRGLTDNNHPIIKVRGTNANGYTILGDDYGGGDESQFTMGLAYSGASLVTGWGVRVSTSANNTYLSSQDTYSTKHSAIKHDGSGLRFLSNGTSQTVTTGSAVTLTERVYITPDGNIGINATAPQQKLDVVGSSSRAAVFRPDNSSTSAYGNASAVNNLINLRMPYGENPGSTNHGGARWGITFQGRNDNADYGTDTGKSASIYGVSEDTLGYNRQVGLAFYTSDFDVNQTERLRITHDGKMGLGETTPLGLFHIKSGDSGAASVGASADEFVIEGSANAGMTILSGTSGEGLLNFADSGDVNVGSVVYSHSDNAMRFKTADSERLRITSTGKVGIPAAAESSALLGINAASTSELTDSSPLYNQGNPCYLQIKNTTDDISDPECGIILQPRNSANGSVAIFAKRTGSYTSDLVYRVRTGSSTSAVRLRIKNDGNISIGDVTSPDAKVHIRNSASYGKDTYATANTGGSQSEPPGTFKWDNATPVASNNGRGYRAWVQSGDAYPNASNYIDVLIRNSGFYRITLKRSHSSVDAAVCQMMIYGLANSGNNYYPVVHMAGAFGSGTNHSTAQSGGGRGSSNAVATFYWEIHSYNVNTHDTIIRIHTTGNNNQGIVALIEKI